MKELIRKIKTKKFFNDKAILCKKDHSGRTIAHLQASYGWTTNDLDILKLADKDGWTVAHEMASNGCEIYDKEVLMLSDKNGWTVAHEMAMNSSYILKNEAVLKYEVLMLKDKNNKSVYDVLYEKYNIDFLDSLDLKTKEDLIL